MKTDTNGSGDYDSVPTEVKSLSYANGLDADSNRMITSVLFPAGSTKENPVSLLTIRNKMAIVPEIVGGNGELSYTMALQKYVDSSTGWADAYNHLDSALNDSEGAATTGTVDDYDNPAVGFIEFEPYEMVSEGFQDGDHQKVSMVITDSTPGSNSSDDSKSMKVEITLILDFKLHDSTLPNVKIKPLYWNSKDDNSLFGNSTKNGHIELPGDLPSTGFDASDEYDKDPKVSGKIRIDGVAQDDALLTNIKIDMFGKTGLTVGSFNGTWQVETPLVEGAIPSGGYAFDVTEDVSYGELLAVGIIPSIPAGKRAVDLVPQYGDYGHVAKWTAYIDTETIMETKAADSNQTVVVYASDRGKNPTPSGYDDPNTSIPGTLQSGGNDGSGNATDFYRLDVVPYITGVTTKLSALKRSNPSVYARTAQGHYAVADQEAIAIAGFNLTGGTISYAKEGGTVTDTYAVAAKAIPADAKSGEVSISVGSMVSLNNMNKNDAKGSYAGTVDLSVKPTGDKSVYDSYYYNRQPNGENNNLLTDDVVLDVWDVNSKVGKPAGGALTQPVMDINPVSGMVGFAFRNGALMMSMGSADYSYDYWLCGLDVWTSIGFAYDDLGYGWGTAAGGDINNTSADSFALLSSRWGTGTIASNASDVSKITDVGHNDGRNQIRPYTIGQKDYDEAGSSFVNIDKERFQSPTLATTVDGTASTVYLAYYDNMNNEIRFHWGTFTTNTKVNAGTQNLFSDAYGRDNAINGKDITKDYAKYRLDYTSLIAGQTKNAHPYTGTPTDTRVLATDGTEVNAGQYVSISALKGQGTDGDDALVAVWYDGKNNQMLYSYNKKPKSISAGKFLQADTGWSKPVAIFGEGNGIGEYCKVALAKDGSAHVVAYDSLNADVVYAFVPSFDTPSGAKTCIVDSYGLIGTELDITAALDADGNPLPFISYYAGSNAKPKAAKWAGSSLLSASTLKPGAIDEVFTGAWDVSLIPTSSKIAVDHINVGVWKDKDTGKIKNSTPGTNKPEQTGTSYKSSVSRGSIYGNGSTNAILGYAINEGSSGYLETAQMK